MSFVNFIQADGTKVLQKSERQYCFSSIFSSPLAKGTTEILVYQPHFNPAFTDQQVADWLAVLNQLNFPIVNLGKGSAEAKKYGLPDTHIVIQVPVAADAKKNHVLSILTLARYLWEYSEPDFNDGEEFGNYAIIEAFFKIREAVPKIDLFKNLLLSFVYKGKGRTLHSCSDTSIRLFITRAQLQANFDKKGGIYVGGSDLFDCWDTGEPINMVVDPDYTKMYAALNGKIAKTRVYVVGNDVNYANWLPNIKIVKTLKSADLVLFTGGEDVDPSLYGEPKHPFTGSNLERDLYEQKIYKQATK
jgi:hypothetical protein